jgi:hypothetical protein
MNHRAEWYNLIYNFNKEDKTKLAKEILKESDMYVGMREYTEILKCIEENLFDKIIAVYDPRKPSEPNDSFNINIFEISDIIICNNGSLEKLRKTVEFLFK